jgi:ATP-dependent Zn protease
VIETYRDKLDRVAELLIEKETIDHADLTSIIDGASKVEAEPISA